MRRQHVLLAAFMALRDWLGTLLHHRLAWALGGVAVIGLGIDSSRVYALLGQFLAAWLLGRAWQILAHGSGLFSFAHAIPLACGAFAMVWSMRGLAHASPLWLTALPIGAAIAGGCAGVLVGALAARVSGTVFAMITFGLGELGYLSAQAMPTLFGGEAGLGADRALAAAHDMHLASFASAGPLHLLLTAWTAFALWCLHRIEESDFGATMRLVRDNPVRAQMLGLHALRVRFQAIVLSFAASGIAGALLALQYELASPELFAPSQSVEVVMTVLLAGVAVPAGPAIGAGIQVAITHVLAIHWLWWQMAYGALFIVVMLVRPGGICTVWPRRSLAARKPLKYTSQKVQR